jgi:hypothetical protein
MATKKNINGLANHAASVIIRQIGEKHFMQPPENAFTVIDMMREFPHIGENGIRGKLDKLVNAGELKSGMFGRSKFYWKAQR